MSQMDESILAALTSATSVAIISAIIQAVVGKRKMSADTAKIIEEAAGSAIKRSEDEIKRVYDRLAKAEAKITQMGESMSAMQKQMHEKDRRVFDLEDQVEELNDDLIAMVEYIEEMHEYLRSSDPHHRLLTPPPRIANHFQKDKDGRRIARQGRERPEEPPPRIQQDQN